MSRQESAARGMGGAAGGWTNSMIESGSGDLGTLMLWFVGLPVVMVGGAVVGALQAQKESDAQRVARTLESLYKDSTIPRAIASRMTEHETRVGIAFDTTRSSPASWTDSPGASFDAILNLDCNVLMTSEANKANPLTAWHVRVRAALHPTQKREGWFTGEYVFNSRVWKFSEWARDSSRLLREELDRAYRSLAEKVVDEVFMVEPITSRKPHIAAWDSSRSMFAKLGDRPLGPGQRWVPEKGAAAVTVGLRPIDPPTYGPGQPQAGAAKMRMHWGRAHGRRPTLRWETLIAAATRDSGIRYLVSRASNITYDLRIATAIDDRPGILVYHREGLTAAEHALEEPLRPGARYFWTVRACYEIEGRRCVTEWGATHPLGRAVAEVPSVFSYRFRVGR